MWLPCTTSKQKPNGLPSMAVTSSTSPFSIALRMRVALTPLAFIFHCGHDVHFAAVGFAELFQPLRVARRELTETEIRATGDALHVQTEAQKVCQSAPRATLRPVQNPA